MRGFISRIILLVGDIIVFYVALASTFYLRTWLGKAEVLPIFHLSLSKLLSTWWIPVIYILSLFSQNLYTFRYPFWEEVHRIVKGVFFATIIILTIVSLGKLSEHVSRSAILILGFISIPLLSFNRRLLKHLLFKLGIWEKKVTAIGNKDFLNKISHIINHDFFMGYKVVEKLELKKLLTQFPSLNTETAIVAIPENIEDSEKFLAQIQRITKEILFVPDIKGLAFLNSELFPLFFSETFLLYVKNNLKSTLNKSLKSCFDFCLSLILLPLLLPIIGIIAILIKLDSKGPVFFVHTRIGKNGKPIKVIKFRTMYTDAQERLKKLLEENPEAKKEWETYYKLKNDPRVTKVGKFLRKTSLDELPQIFNVIKGDMSLVGPRPVIKEEIEKYYKEFAQYYYMVKPGITGLWQVSGRSDTDYEKRVRLDTWYVLNWSLWLDIVILIKTVKTVLKKEGAY